jgi:hypothetical protein
MVWIPAYAGEEGSKKAPFQRKFLTMITGYLVNPKDVQEILDLPIDDCKTIAAMIHKISLERVLRGNDRSYEKNDFVMKALEGIWVKKKKWDETEKERKKQVIASGKKYRKRKFKVEQVRGYIRSYSNFETKQKKLVNVDIMHAGLQRCDIEFAQNESNYKNTLDTLIEREELEKNKSENDRIEDLLNYINYYYPTIAHFAKTFVKRNKRKDKTSELKTLFGKNYENYLKRFKEVVKQFEKDETANNRLL